MCGYCVESAAISQRIQAQLTGEAWAFDAFFSAYALQEAAELMEGLNTVNAAPPLIATACCKFYEQTLRQGWNAAVSNRLLSSFTPPAMTAYRHARTAAATEPVWAALGDLELYTDETHWNRWVQQADLLQSAITVLQTYAEWWLAGTGKEPGVAPETRLQTTGLLDPIANTTPVDWHTFYARFPAVYCALMVVSHQAPDTELLRRLALNPPHDVPDLLGNDLWLQRKAFVHCVQHQGLCFVLDAIENQVIDRTPAPGRVEDNGIPAFLTRQATLTEDAPTVTRADSPESIAGLRIEAEPASLDSPKPEGDSIHSPCVSLELISSALLTVPFDPTGYAQLKAALSRKAGHFEISHVSLAQVLALIDHLIQYPLPD